MSYPILPSDVAFQNFLDGFDPAQFSDVEFRMFKQAKLRVTR